MLSTQIISILEQFIADKYNSLEFPDKDHFEDALIATRNKLIHTAEEEKEDLRFALTMLIKS